jgi:O-antigen/teichoic acid export membrane protein
MTPILVSGLGAEGFGIWVVVGSFVLYRDILELGLAAATPKYVAEFAAVEDRGRLRAAIATSVWLLAIPGTLALLLGVGAAVVFPGVFGVSTDLAGAAQVLVLIVAVDFALAMPGDTFSGVLTGLQRYDLLNLTLIVVSLTQATAIAVVIGAGGGLVALGVATVAISLAGQVWRYSLAKRLVPEMSLSPRCVDRRFIRPFTGLSIWLGVSDASTVILSRIDTIVVGAVLGVEAAGIYAVGQKLALAIPQLTAPSVSVFYPHASELAVLGDRAGLQQSLFTSTRIQFAVAAPLALTLAVLAKPAIDAWVGPEFDAAATVVVFLAAAGLIWAVVDSGYTLLIGIGKARRPALIRVSEAAINFGLSIVLAHVIGLEGVALATLLAASAAYPFVLIPYACRVFGVRFRDLAVPLVAAHAIPFVVSLAVGLALAASIPETIPAVGVAAAATLGVYLGTLAFTGLDRGERHMLVSRLRRVRPRPYRRRA